jgi:hypothetical protein
MMPRVAVVPLATLPSVLASLTPIAQSRAGGAMCGKP